MRQKKNQTVFSLLLMIIFFPACSSPSNSPTIEPRATEAIQPTATEPVTELTATLEGGQGFCANPYYPVRQGATWSYTSTGGPAGAYSFTDTITSARDDGFTLSTQFGDLSRTQEWACAPEGLVALQLGGAPAAMLNTQGMQLDLEVKNATGVTFPNQINPGDQWQHNLDFEGNMTVANQEGSATGNAQTNFTAIGNESVTVPAGTFDAMKIQMETTINISVSYQGLSVPVTFSATYDYWLAEGVGWVRSSGTGEMAGTSFSEITELQSSNVP